MCRITPGKGLSFWVDFLLFIMRVLSSSGTWSLVAGIYDGQEVWFQRCTSYKESINIWLGDELSSVLSWHGTSILYTDVVWNFFRYVCGHPLSDVGMGSFGDFWGSSLSGSNSPDWFVSEDNFVPVSDGAFKGFKLRLKVGVGLSSFSLLKAFS